MRKIPMFLFMATALIAVSCKDKNTESKSESLPMKELHESHKTTENSGETHVLNKGVVVFESNQITELFEAYQMVSEGLVNTDFETSKIYANKLLESIRNSGVESSKRLEKIVISLENAGDIAAFRAGFFDLNKELEPYFKKELLEGEIYIQYCPMAFNDTGAYWFASDKEIMNPYFGDVMLHCGEIKETIK